jgi:hypothetical protein
MKIGDVCLFASSHLFGIGRLELHDAATARSSLVVSFSMKSGSHRMAMTLTGNLDNDTRFSVVCAAYVCS